MKVVGEVKLCTKEAVALAPSTNKKDKKKEPEKKKQEAKKKEVKEKAEPKKVKEEEEAPAPAPEKKKDPLDALPKVIARVPSFFIVISFFKRSEKQWI